MFAKTAHTKKLSSNDGETLALVMRTAIARYHALYQKTMSQKIRDMQECLQEQERLLAASPGFPNKDQIAKCGRMSLILIDQISRDLNSRDINQTTGHAS